MENYQIKINNHIYSIKGLSIAISPLVEKTFALDHRLTPEDVYKLLHKGLIEKLLRLMDGKCIATNDEGLEYWEKHEIDPIETVEGYKIVASILKDLRKEIEHLYGQRLKWWYEIDPMTKEQIKRYDSNNRKALNEQIDDFSKSAEKGEIICISDLMGNAGM